MSRDRETTAGRRERSLRDNGLRPPGLGRAVRPCSEPAVWSSAGTETRGRPVRRARAPRANVEASSCGDGGPRRRACRGAPAGLTGGTGPGTEVSSPPPDSRRSEGRGGEEASGTTRVRTPGSPGVRSIHTRPPFSRRGCRAERGTPSQKRGRKSRTLGHGPRVRRTALTSFARMLFPGRPPNPERRNNRSLSDHFEMRRCERVDHTRRQSSEHTGIECGARDSGLFRPRFCRERFRAAGADPEREKRGYTGGCKYVKTRIENPGGKGLSPQIAETGE